MEVGILRSRRRAPKWQRPLDALGQQKGQRGAEKRPGWSRGEGCWPQAQDSSQALSLRLSNLGESPGFLLGLSFPTRKPRVNTAQAAPLFQNRGRPRLSQELGLGAGAGAGPRSGVREKALSGVQAGSLGLGRGGLPRCHPGHRAGLGSTPPDLQRERRRGLALQEASRIPPLLSLAEGVAAQGGAGAGARALARRAAETAGPEEHHVIPSAGRPPLPDGAAQARREGPRGLLGAPRPAPGSLSAGGGGAEGQACRMRRGAARRPPAPSRQPRRPRGPGQGRGRRPEPR